MFWSLISPSFDCCEVVSRATALASALPPAALVTAQQKMDALLHESYTAELWAAAGVMTGWCSDDGFDYFQGWLLTRGPEVFATAVAEPDTLADQLRPSWLGYECENALYVVSAAYREATGSSIPTAPHPGRDFTWPFDPDDEEVLRSRFPRLTALFRH